MIKDELLKIPNLYKKNGSLNGNVFRDKNVDLMNRVIKHTAWMDTQEPLNMRLYCVLNNITSYPLCKCGSGKQLQFSDAKVGFRSYCTVTCSLKLSDTANKISGRKMSDESKKKQKATLLNKYGVDNYFKSKDFIRKNYTKELVEKRGIARLKAMNQKYGVDNPFQLKSVNDKIKQNNIRLYGVEYYNQKDLSSECIKNLLDKQLMTEYAEKYTSNYIGELLGCDSSTVLKYMKILGIDYKRKTVSKQEQMLNERLKLLGVDYDISKRGLFANPRLEVDFYFPNHNLAVEINGLYWHSELVRSDKLYHQNKYDKLKDVGIELIQFWDYEVNNNIDLCVSIIKHKLGLSEHRVYARKTKVVTLDTNTASNFITHNHLQSIEKNNIHYAIGLMLDDVLVSVMSFTRQGDMFMLQRFCSLQGYSVVGGFSKLLKHFRSNVNHSRILTYSDCRYSSGDVYQSNGFKLQSTTKEPTYYYTNNFKSLTPKWLCRKANISKLYPTRYDKNKTEHENMKALGYVRVYGCLIKTWCLQNNR